MPISRELREWLEVRRLIGIGVPLLQVLPFSIRDWACCHFAPLDIHRPL